MPHAEVQRYYDLIDVLAYPRLPMRLTELVTPLKPLEAMAQGRMFVASDVGGHRELVRDGETGFLFPAGDAAALARAIDGVLARTADWPRMRAQARRFVETERTWARSVARYAERLFERCYGQRRPPRSADSHASRTPQAMCGIHGYPPARRRGRRSGDALRGDGPRSPCIAGRTTRVCTSTARCAIGMRRLSIIDLAGGHQPLIERRRHALARVQRRDLQLPRAAQRARGARATGFTTHSDSEVAAASLRRAGATTVVDRLNGMFGFALWDARRRRLLIGRDRLGIKPLYVLSDGRRLAFAIGGEGAARAARRRAELDPDAVAALSAARLRAGAALDLPRHPQAAAGDVADGRGRTRQRAALLADLRARSIARAPSDEWVERGARAARANRCACRW